MATIRCSALFLASLQLLLFFCLGRSASSDRILIEEGYAVTTVIDGRKLGINPHSVLPMYGSSRLIVLDSVDSSFYLVSLPGSDDIPMERLSGNGVAGYSDGEMASAKFNQPRSFAVDLKGNVYVADRSNHAIRKITSSGVTTIAGGSQKTGRADGPGQNASFSNDFELSFIPGSCSLLVSDHGNLLVRQILLKEEDCGTNNGSSSAMTAVSIWALGLCISGFLGLAIGIAIRPHIFPHERTNNRSFSVIWKHCLTNLGKQTWIHFSGIRNGVAKSIPFQLLRTLILLSISQLFLMFRFFSFRYPNRPEESFSLLDSDSIQPEESFSLLDSNSMSTDEVAFTRSSQIYDQLNGLKTFEGAGPSKGTDDERLGELSSVSEGKIDYMIRENIMAFQGMTGSSVQLNGSASSGSLSGLVKRR